MYVPEMTPLVEQKYVKDFYNKVAKKWNKTRYKPWPKINKWINMLPPSVRLAADIGCGNGKNFCCWKKETFVIGMDISLELLKYSTITNKNDIVYSDAINLPYKDGTFDSVICIAVLHHISSVERRVVIIREIARIITTGSKALFYVWAWNQEKTGTVTKHRFPKQDVIIPFNDNIRNTIENRYCHLYNKDELESLIKKFASDILVISNTWTDTGNYAIEVTKINPPLR